MSPTKMVASILSIAAVGVGGYFVYKKFFASPRLIEQPKDFSSPQVKTGAPMAAAVSPLKRVNKGEDLATVSTRVSRVKNTSYKYAKITNSYQDNAGRTISQFRSPVDGFYTGVLFTNGKQTYAEIKPL